MTGPAAPELRFASIDLARDLDVCVRFRRDSLVCSFGHDDEFEKSGGTPAYLEWLRTSRAAFPEGIVHAYVGDAIVGQLEMQVRGREGRVNLFYLAPEWRGRGLGDPLHDQARRVLLERGVAFVMLLVSPGNSRAIRYYEKHGWIAGGAATGRPDLREMWLKLP